MNKKIKLISLISTPVLLGGGFAALTLVNQCGNNESIRYNLDGTNWEGYNSTSPGNGTLTCVKLDTRDAYKIVSRTGDYIATNLVIPDEVWDGNKFCPLVEIGENVFSRAATLSGSLSLGANIEVIGNNAFDSCININNLFFSNSRLNYINIGDNAFDNCHSITSLLLPSYIYSIGNRAFGGLGLLTSLTFYSTLFAIGGNAFNGMGSETTGMTLKLLGFDEIWNPHDGAEAGVYEWANSEDDAVFTNIGKLSGGSPSNTIDLGSWEIDLGTLAVSWYLPQSAWKIGQI